MILTEERTIKGRAIIKDCQISIVVPIQYCGSENSAFCSFKVIGTLSGEETLPLPFLPPFSNLDQLK